MTSQRPKIARETSPGSGSTLGPPRSGRPHRSGKKSSSSFWRELRRLGRYRPFARRHLRACLGGTAAAVAVVALRLALPWPLKALVDPWVVGAEAAGETVASPVPGGALGLGVSFLLLAVGLGWADRFERLSFARFAIGIVRDLRSRAFAAVTGAHRVPGAGTGDLVARLIGDTARVKAGIKGFLVHVATNGVFFVGVSLVFLWLLPPVGLIFAAGALSLAVLTYAGAARIHRRAVTYRRKEGKLAEAIHRSASLDPSQASFARVNRSSGQHEAALTGLQTLATAGAHVVFGLTVLGAWAAAWRSAAAAQVDAGVLILLAIYSLSLRGPMVQLARQGVRTGKILAGLQRLGHLLDLEAETRDSQPPLTRSFELRRVTIKSRRSLGKARRLSGVNLEIEAGQRVALVGPRGAGKSTLLRLLAGAERRYKGELLWDGEPRWPRADARTTPRIAYLSDAPDWPRVRVAEYLRLAGARRESVERVADLCGLERLFTRLPNGPATKLSGSDLSKGERRSLALARALLSGAPLLLLDEPFGEEPAAKVAAKVEMLVAIAYDSTIVMALPELPLVACLDRVVELSQGSLLFDGLYSAWRRQATGDQPRLRLAGSQRTGL